VRSRTSASFRKALESLPPQVRAQARRAYELFRTNPNHPGLRFKPVHPSRPIYSVRIGIGVLEGDDIIWFWVGSHDEYERLINQP